VVPDGNEEYLLYQTLVGIWPWTKAADDHEQLISRVQEYMTKAVHEAKVNLSWINQNQEYVGALCSFIAAILNDHGRANSFSSLLEEFLKPVSYFGMINSLAQATLKMMCPGNPDMYQGTELWDFSLVDPDNRRPVDFDLRKKMLSELRTHPEPATLVREFLENYQDGRIKMWITMRALELRREYPGLFQKGTYVPLESSDRNQYLCAFARIHEESGGKEAAIVVVPRLPYTLMAGKPESPISDVWGDATITLPEGIPAELRNALTDKKVAATDRKLLCREIFETLPVAVLVAS
jgi:(1->4)-alpha-D-glucan 1-alpha-D-glucosylmutase